MRLRPKAIRWRPAWSDAVIVAAVLFAFHPTVTGAAHIPYDAEYYHYPLLRHVQSLVSSGTLPGWDSFAYGGSPLLANAQSAWLYPPHLVLALVLAILDKPLTEHTLDVVLVGHLVLAGLAMAAIVRRRGLGEAAAAFAGVFVVLMGGTVSQAEHVGMIEALPWIVLAVFAVDYLATGITPLRVIALGASFALAITAGFLPVIPAAAALIVGTAVARGAGRRPALLGALPGLALGALMAAAALLPTAAVLHVYPPLAKHSVPFGTSGFVTAVIPNAFGHWGASLLSFSGPPITNSYFYLGGAALILLPIALTSGAAALWDAGLVLVLLLCSVGAPATHVLTALQNLPAVGTLWRPEDVVYVAAVPFTLLVARGLARPPSDRQLVAAVVALAALVLVSFTGGHGVALHFLQAAPTRTIVALAVATVALLAAVILETGHRRAATAALAVVAVIGAAELATTVPGRYFINAPGPATSSGPSSTGDSPSVLSFLWRHTNAQDRIAADVPFLGPPWAGFPPVWHLSDANGFQPQFSNYQLAAGQAPGAPPQHGDREFDITPALHTYLEEMGVRYVVVSPTADAFVHARGYVPVFRDALYHVYETSWPHDRAYLVDPGCIGRRGAGGVIACRTPTVVATTTSSNSRRYRFAVAGRATLLVTGEPWYPGWRAADASGSLPVRRVGFLTAVTVPAGVGDVSMSYRPPGLLIGAVISLLAIGGSLLAIVWTRRRRAGPDPLHR
jgi:hypothetical protein